ncbi:MAG: NADH-quinone oxidoreductase subunit C, partial [Thermomicrobia bacterium]|nr:NADH-quinone oxidoreductase subunit C [Thermomicrobia bacterium]
ARLSDITAIDTLRYPVAMPGQIARGTPRFGVIYHLAARPPGTMRLRLRVFVPESGAIVPSVVALWPGANFFEREIYDLMGITFTGHPDLRRIMLAEEWVGHPLRKDMSVGGEPVEFTHTVAAITGNRRKADA